MLYTGIKISYLHFIEMSSYLVLYICMSKIPYFHMYVHVENEFQFLLQYFNNSIINDQRELFIYIYKSCDGVRYQQFLSIDDTISNSYQLPMILINLRIYKKVLFEYHSLQMMSK